MSAQLFTIYDIFKMNSAKFPDNIAMVDQGKTITFKEFYSQVNSLANGLKNQGMVKKDRLAVLSMNRYEYFLVYGAAAALGLILVPLNWRLARQEIGYILKDSGAKFLFYDTSQEEQALSLKKEGPFEGEMVCFDTPNNSGDISFKEFMDSPAVEQDNASADDIFCLIYTAAVEGNPRGAALSHNNIIISNLQTSLTMTLGARDAYLNMLPMFHITGINLGFAVMHMGGKNVIMEKFDARKALDLIKTESVTLMASFPPILTTLMNEMDNGGADTSSLRNITGIDAPDTIKRFTEKTDSIFWALYGQSETSGFVTLSDYSEAPGSAGRQCCVSTVAIIDETDTVITDGTSGEIGVKGPVVFKGYWKKKDELDRSSMRNGWHHTGDMGKIDEEGRLWFEGRKPEKELIKPGGENVYPAEVETVILTHQDIEETCVIGVPDPRFGEGIKAVCVKTENSPLSEKDLIEYVGSRIARYKKPGYVTFVDTLPKTKDGDVDRIKVKEQHSKG